MTRAYILAAGLGRRLWPLTKDRPKSLVDLGDGATLLGRQLGVFTEHPWISDVTVVTGYLDRMIDDFVADSGHRRVQTRFNPFYATSGPIGSLWAVRDGLSADDFLVCNGDTLFRGAVLDRLAADLDGADGVALAASECRSSSPDDVRVEISPTGDVARVGKGLEGDASARSTGIFAVAGPDARRRCIDTLDTLVREDAALAPGTPWHTWVDRISRTSGGVRASLVDDGEWSEVDIHPELEQLRSQLASKIT